MVLKYTRNRTSVPATMIKQVVNDLVQECHPAQEDEDTFLVDAHEAELSSTEFFIKTPSPGSYCEYKFIVHCWSPQNGRRAVALPSQTARRSARPCRILQCSAWHAPKLGLTS